MKLADAYYPNQPPNMVKQAAEGPIATDGSNNTENTENAISADAALHPCTGNKNAGGGQNWWVGGDS